MWAYLLLIVVLLWASYKFKEGFEYTRAGDFRADLFGSKDCPCLSCINQTCVTP